MLRRPFGHSRVNFLLPRPDYLMMSSRSLAEVTSWPALALATEVQAGLY